jgi:hypothetical protein
MLNHHVHPSISAFFLCSRTAVLAGKIQIPCARERPRHPLAVRRGGGGAGRRGPEQQAAHLGPARLRAHLCQRERHARPYGYLRESQVCVTARRVTNPRLCRLCSNIQ